ncbi:MAG: hypothetical protein ACJASX_001606 [Limisphaerales bacterium]|jgi:hypothetical protein
MARSLAEEKLQAPKKQTSNKHQSEIESIDCPCTFGTNLSEIAAARRISRSSLRGLRSSALALGA